MMQLHFEGDIPFYWTAFFHWCAYALYVSLLPKRMKTLPTVLILILFLPVQIALYSVIAPLRGMPFNIGMTLFAVWTLLPFVILCKSPFLHDIYTCARAFIFGGFSVSLAWQLYRYYSIRVTALRQIQWELVFMLGIEAVLVALTALIERMRSKEVQEMRIPVHAVIEAVVIAFAIYILSSISYTALDTPFSAETEEQVFMLRTLIYLAGFALMLALHMYQCNTYALGERDAMQRILDQQYTNYRIRQESIALVNQKYHDLKHQIAVLRREAGAGQRLEYLDRMEREISMFEAENKTGNEVLDTILTGKHIYCHDHGITMTVVADGHALDFMDIMDLSALFGNALDNAIEAAEQVDDPEQRLILLSVSRQKQFLRIVVKNRYNAAPLQDGVLPETTKRDKRYHGYGLKSIRSTVEKYGGSVTMHGADGWFELGILIPLAG